MGTLTSLTTATGTAATMSRGQKRQNRIPCTDGFDRERSMGVWLASGKGRVILVAPPAEAALLTAEQARLLSGRLEEPAMALESQSDRTCTR